MRRPAAAEEPPMFSRDASSAIFRAYGAIELTAVAAAANPRMFAEWPNVAGDVRYARQDQLDVAKEHGAWWSSRTRSASSRDG
jgi:hypothetical protein